MVRRRLLRSGTHYRLRKDRFRSWSTLGNATAIACVPRTTESLPNRTSFTDGVLDEDVDAVIDRILSNLEEDDESDTENGEEYSFHFTWQSLIAVMSVTGSVRFSVDQYTFFVTCVNWLVEYSNCGLSPFPSYSTLQRYILPHVVSSSLPRSKQVLLPLDISKSGASVHQSIQSRKSRNIGPITGGPTIPVSIVLPSSWARHDVSFKPLWEQMKTTSTGAVSNTPGATIHETIEDIPMITDRDHILDPICTAPRPSHSQGVPPIQEDIRLYHGMNLKLTLRAPSKNIMDLLSSFRFEHSPSGSTVLYAKGTQSFLVRRPPPDINFSTNETAWFAYESVASKLKNLWRAGDICTLLKTTKLSSSVPASSGFAHLIVHRHLRLRNSYSPYLLAIVPETSAADLSAAYRSFSATVLSVEASPPQHTMRSNPRSTNATKSFGTLHDGTPYFIYRILLYCDGFSQYNERKGSAGGVYMIPLNLPCHVRSSRRGVRTISLAPPGVSTNAILHEIIGDIVHHSTHGLSMLDADGNHIRVFLDLVAFIGDYPEITNVLDLLGHNSACPCHLCSFKRIPNHMTEASRYCSTIAVHSLDPAFMRTADRTLVIRDSNISSEESKSIGMKDASTDTKKSPLFSLHSALNEAFRTTPRPFFSDGSILPYPHFDPYRSCLVAPDHLLSGIAKNVLNMAFVLLPREYQVLADIHICNALRTNGLVAQHRIFSPAACSMYSMSISGLFSTLSIAPEVFTDLCYTIRANTNSNSSDAHPTTALSFDSAAIHEKGTAVLSTYRQLVANTYWYPSLQTDGVGCVQMYNENAGEYWQHALLRTAEDFLTKSDMLCRLSPLCRQHLDKPNSHRLIELYRHTIPAMGHVRHFGELVFESAHQPLKRIISKSNHQHPHLQAVSHALFDDWKHRISTVMKYGDGHEQLPLSGRSPLLPALNDTVNASHETIGEVGSDRRSTEPQIKLVTNLLSHTPTLTLPTIYSTHWVLKDKWVSHSTDQEIPLNDRYSIEKLLLSAFAEEPREGKLFSYYKSAIRGKTTGNLPPYSVFQQSSVHILRRGTALQSLIFGDVSAPLLCQPYVESDRHFFFDISKAYTFLVCAILSVHVEGGTAEPFAAVWPLPRILSKGSMVIHARKSGLQLLRLTSSVIRVATIHACSTEHKCSANTTLHQVSHSSALLDGGSHYVVDRSLGYPPRTA